MSFFLLADDENITLAQALTEFEIQQIGVGGKHVQLAVDNPGTEGRLSGQRMPKKGGRDFIFRFKVTFTENLSPKQKAAIKQCLA
jgi:DnaJ-class molecular chaperone